MFLRKAPLHLECIFSFWVFWKKTICGFQNLVQFLTVWSTCILVKVNSWRVHTWSTSHKVSFWNIPYLGLHFTCFLVSLTDSWCVGGHGQGSSCAISTWDNEVHFHNRRDAQSLVQSVTLGTIQIKRRFPLFSGSLPQRPTTLRDGPSWSWELGTPTSFPKWRSGTQYWTHHPLPPGMHIHKKRDQRQRQQQIPDTWVLDVASQVAT